MAVCLALTGARPKEVTRNIVLDRGSAHHSRTLGVCTAPIAYPMGSGSVGWLDSLPARAVTRAPPWGHLGRNGTLVRSTCRRCRDHRRSAESTSGLLFVAVVRAVAGLPGPDYMDLSKHVTRTSVADRPQRPSMLMGRRPMEHGTLTESESSG